MKIIVYKSANAVPIAVKAPSCLIAGELDEAAKRRPHIVVRVVMINAVPV